MDVKIRLLVDVMPNWSRVLLVWVSQVFLSLQKRPKSLQSRFTTVGLRGVVWSRNKLFKVEEK